MFIWPFRTKSASQYRRIDQGWDLQGQGPGEEECLAIYIGTVHYAHDPGSNGAHFGDPYPVLWLPQPIDGVRAIYYGHTHPTVPEGTPVNQGDVIARTSTPGGGGVSAPHWLEIGPWNVGPTGNGQWMHDHLINAPVFEGDDFMSALNDAEQRELLENTRWIRATLANDDGALKDIQSRIGNIVQPDVEKLVHDEPVEPKNA